MQDGSDWRELIVRVGNKTQFKLSSVVSDLNGSDPLELKSAIESDAVEMRINNIREFKLTPYLQALGLAEWDRDVLLSTWPPLYSDCSRISLGDMPVSPSQTAVSQQYIPHNSENSRAVLSLAAACRGCLGQLTVARQALDYAKGVYGPEKTVHLGSKMDTSDFTWAGVLCGFCPGDLGHLDRALCYAEAQLAKAWLAVTQDSPGVAELESHSLHAGTILLLAQEILETIKTSLFGFSTAANQELSDIAWYPPPIWTGQGAMEKGKKSVVFIGDNFVSACLLVGLLRSGGACEDVEVCGIGQAADDLPRFYERARWVGTMVKAKKVLRTGAFDVIVESEGCLSFDLVEEARRTGSKLIWTGTADRYGLKDVSPDDDQRIVEDLAKGLRGVWIRDLEKAARVVLKLLQSTDARPGKHVMDEETARQQALRCREDCDLCSYACPNAVMVSKGVKELASGHGLKALSELEKKCCLFGKCDQSCPEKIPITDMMVAAFALKAREDRFLFRSGRGGGQRAEMGANDATASPGNSPGWFGIIGCGRSNPEDVQWMANELASRNGIVSLAGCTAGDVAHMYLHEEKKWFVQKYPFLLQPRCAANLGGCSACQFLPTTTLKNSRSMAGVTHYANYVETVAAVFDRLACITIVWGPLPERMHAIVSGLVRAGISVVVGPIAGLDWERLMPGNKWDWQRYWAYETLGQRKKTVEPSPKHMIMAAETPEEAVNMAMCHNIRPAQGFRMSFLEGYLDTHQQYFKELPDDWHRYVRSPSDLPIAARIRLMNELTGKHGWKIEGMAVRQIPLPDGRVVDQKQYVKEYGAGGAPVTRVPRLCIKSLHERKN